MPKLSDEKYIPIYTPILKDVSLTPMDKLLLAYLHKWYHFYTEEKGVDYTPSNIQLVRNLGSDIDDIFEAADNLERLGLLRITFVGNVRTLEVLV